MQQLVTTDSILNYLKECVEHKRPVDAHTWLDAAQKLTMLLEDEHDKLFELDHLVAAERADYMESGDTAAKAKVKIEATAAFKEARKQKAKITRIEEMVRIAKIQARMKDTEMRAL